MAWHSVDNPATQPMVIDRAPQGLAFAVGLLFRGMLQGIIAFLSARGTTAAASRVPELVGKLRASKLGAGFAEWIERNWKGLIENPHLQGEQKSSVSQIGGSATEQLPKTTTTEAPPKTSSTPAPGKSGSPEHKAQRWANYKARTAPDERWSYDRWSKTYDLNMRRAIEANKAVDAYHEEIGGWGEREVTVDVEGVPRRLDIADETALRGIEYKPG